MMDKHDNELERLEAGELNKIQPPERPLMDYIISHGDLLKKDIAPVEYLLGSWFPLQSFGMVYAKPGVGKSWFCMALAVALANGSKRFLGWSINKTVRTLYVDGEMCLADIRDRFKSLSRESLEYIDILPSEEMFLENTPLSLDRKEHQQWFHNLLQGLEDKGRKPQMIIFDNLSTLRNSVNENDNSETQKLVSWLVALRAHGYTVLAVHHAGKNGDQRGASILTVPMNYSIKLSQPNGDYPIREGETRFEVSLGDKIRAKRPNPMHFDVVLGPDESGLLKLSYNSGSVNIEPRYRLLRFIGQFGKKSYREMREKTDISTGSIGNYLTKLMSEGLLTGLKNDPKVSRDGHYLLHEYWPKEFPLDEQFEFIQPNDVPF